ncbi:hypothetical protein EKD02_00980 [Chlorobium phaeovibrioides]|uniref:Uncharacterized protein n=1 Tax=Chlorobium phaeovibrioides TaxID=1094 RepID=A0A3S0P0T0_CHLPH|nr:hypothetical protein [Chlorobium phaeovibrioides]MWV54283.1 hypothetical protein [Chlorobium phaeovibrioides]RTY40001.1 hypothetical protein EKD02_00980 [Chlorobium phaeovibrioides]
MKNFWMILVFTFLVIQPNAAQADEKGLDIAPYIKVADVASGIDVVSRDVQKSLTNKGFEILGTYSPAQNPKLQVIAYTRADLKNAVIKVADRGAMAGVLKVGLVKKGDTVAVSYLNPSYIFNAYLRKETPKHQKVLKKVSDDVRSALVHPGTEPVGFGGGIRAEKLWKYHYKFMMPYFSDPKELNTFTSFEEGLRTIESNLNANKSSTKEVYRLVFPAQKTAVIGIALMDKENGEAEFLPIIGEENIAAMPYEIILQNNTVTMLPGRYRIALSWPDLSMGTFMKIMSTPNDIKDMMKSLTE